MIDFTRNQINKSIIYCQHSYNLVKSMVYYMYIMKKMKQKYRCLIGTRLVFVYCIVMFDCHQMYNNIA